MVDHKVAWPPLDNHVTFYSGNKTHFSLLGSHTVRSGLQPIRELEIDELEIDEKLQEDDLLKRNELEGGDLKKVGKDKEKKVKLICKKKNLKVKVSMPKVDK